MGRIAIYGFGGLGRELITPLMRTANAEVLFVDDNPAAESFAGVPVRHSSELRPGDRFVLAIGNSGTRRLIEGRCRAAGLTAYSLIAPAAEVDPDVVLGDGAVVCANAMITAGTRIGRQFQCNIYSYVAHDCEVGDFVTFAPRVSCNGNVHIGHGAFIGSGAVLKNGVPGKPLVIGENAVVGMGAVVTKDVPPGATVVGNPARILGARPAELEVRSA